MKKLVIYILTVIALTGCYEDFRLDHVFSGVAFSNADGGSNIEGVLHRTVVKDEGLALDVGINLTGILENTEERWADFEIDPLLVDTSVIGSNYMLMPEDYYTLSDDRFVIPAGDFLGKVTITLDSAKFVNDPLALTHTYVIPFRLTATSEDSIIGHLSTKVVAVKYINHYAGFYDQTGTVLSYDADGKFIDTIEVVNSIEMLTVALDTVVANGMVDQKGNAYQMTLLNNGNSVTLGNTPASAANTIEPTGDCVFDEETATFSLSYKVTDASGAYKTANMSLVWRNRIRDGVNEWRR